MDEGDARRVQMHAGVTGDAVGRGIERIADDGVAKRQEMDAQLMRAAGDRLEFDAGDGVVALAACEPPPDPPAAKLFDAWKAGKPSQATGDFTTYAAKQQMFSQAWTSSAQWAFITCDGAAGSTYCTWVNRLEGRLVLREKLSSYLH